MKYYLGPWVWTEGEIESYWDAPAGTVARVDLRTIPQQSQRVTANGVGFFASDTPLSAEYTFLGEGYISDILVSDSVKDAWEQRTGFRPNGLTLLDLLWDQLTTGSSPDGMTGVGPLMPNSSGNLELHLRGHSIVRKEKFIYGIHPHTDKVRQALQNKYRKVREISLKKKDNLYLKFLDFCGEKYSVINPDLEFIPNDLPKESPLKHETTRNDTFDRSNSDTLGTSSDGDWSWTETQDDSDIVSNRFDVGTAGGNGPVAICQGALSGDDHYTQIDLAAMTISSLSIQVRVLVRADNAWTSAVGSAYYTQINKSSGVFDLTTFKRIDGTSTAIGLAEAQTEGLPDTIKCEINGSTLKSYFNDVEVHSDTDPTPIEGGLYTGIWGRRSVSGNTTQLDNFQCADIAGGTDVTVTPAVLSITASVQAPTVSGSANVSINALSITANQISPTVSYGSTIGLSVLNATVNLIAPTPITDGGVTVSVGVLTLTTNTIAPNISGSANISPAVLMLLVNLIAPTVSGSALISPDVQTVNVNLNAPTIQTGGNLTVSVGVLSLTVNQNAPIIIGDVLKTLNVLQLTANLIAPNVQIDKIFVAEVLGLVASAIDPTITTVRNISISPDVLSITVNINAPHAAQDTDVTVIVSSLTATVSVISPTIRMHITVPVSALSVIPGLIAPSVSVESFQFILKILSIRFEDYIKTKRIRYNNKIESPRIHITGNNLK